MWYRALAAGKVRAIGVSNFDVAQLQQLRVWAQVPPAVVQRNSDIFSADVVAQSFSGANGWVYEAGAYNRSHFRST